LTRREDPRRRIFVLDTNVLMHDPTALFRFDEHDIYLPMVVLEELDAGKKGVSEAARNVRQVSRFIDQLIHGLDKAQIDHGIDLPGEHKLNGRQNDQPGRLFFQTRPNQTLLPDTLPGSRADNSILENCLMLQEMHPEARVTLVSKDINLRIKAAILGVNAEDYYSDVTLDDVDLLYSGTARLEPDFWETHSKAMDSWQEEGRTFYRVSGPAVAQWHPNQLLFIDDDSNFEAVVRSLDGSEAVIELAENYRSGRNNVWGISARNREQNYALNLLMSDKVDFATILGPAGTGKTYLAVASAVDALQRDAVRRLVLVRPAVEAGERLGFLPGDMAQKVDPYLRPMYDALYEMIGFERVARLIERNVIEVAPLAYMRGRTLNEAFIILDEAQNTTPEQMKMFLTRIGFGSKAVITGDVTQIDLPRGTVSGLIEAQHILRGVRGLGFTYFTAEDVVRHPLVARIVEAYEAAEAGGEAGEPAHRRRGRAG